MDSLLESKDIVLSYPWERARLLESDKPSEFLLNAYRKGVN